MHHLHWTQAIAVVGLSLGAIAPAWGQTVNPQITQTSGLEALNRPTLTQGSQGSTVAELQAALKLLGYYSGTVDGVFAEDTAIAVSRFQQAAGIGADGIVGPNTWYRLFPPVAFAASPPIPAPVSPVTVEPSYGDNPTPSLEEFPILRRGMSGPAVERLQVRLQEMGFYDGGIDGDFGEETEAAVLAAQERYDLEVDGIVGSSTWNALFQ